jgi:hypothetical protein
MRLFLDVVPSVQQTTGLTLDRLANYCDNLGECVVGEDISSTTCLFII